MIYDCLVLGAGHAGLEAAFAFANQNLKVGLITIDSKLIANMPCNPSIGGPAKGVVTREIDALGGMQAFAADQCKIQIKLLNESKGAGVQALRAQIDKVEYHKFFKKIIEENKNIDIIEGIAQKLIITNGIVQGMIINDQKYLAKTVIIASGTFLDSKVFIGNESISQGPDGFATDKRLANNLKEIGFELIRLKTGTPPRLEKDSINYDLCEIDNGNNDQLCFSNFNNYFIPKEEQINCWLTYTNLETHKLINENLSSSPMYSGAIKSVGPRYCPSIEDKIVRFNDKLRHQIFVELESIHLNTVYLAGISTSLPKNVQDKMIRSIPAFKDAIILKYAYAIEYFAINPNQLKHTLESKRIKNLFFAGQINGTSGYEEAAAQGLIAGINAANIINNRDPYIPSRASSYTGLLIDDIVTKEITEPYRLLTSKCEYRLLIRNDNSDDRLIHAGYSNGLISKEIYEKFLENDQKRNKNIEILKSTMISKVKDFKFDFRKQNISLYDVLKKPEFNYKSIEKFIELETLDNSWKNKIEIAAKYEGYIKAQEKIIKNYEKLKNIELKGISNYKDIPNLSLEAIDKLNKIKPHNLGQITQISTISINDILNIKMFLQKKESNHE